jgi:hypothetical protein
MHYCFIVFAASSLVNVVRDSRLLLLLTWCASARVPIFWPARAWPHLVHQDGLDGVHLGECLVQAEAQRGGGLHGDDRH